MKIQNDPGIYVYFVDVGLLTKKLRWYHFETWKSFFQYFKHKSVIAEQFGDYDKLWFSADALLTANWRGSCFLRAYFAAYDQDGNWFSPQQLIQKQAEYEVTRKKHCCDYIHKRRHGRKKKAWGHYHAIKVLRSNRSYFIDPDVEELGLNVKYRSKANPPDSWDREKFSHLDKSWKTQSKRDHQWKEHKRRG